MGNLTRTQGRRALTILASVLALAASAALAAPAGAWVPGIDVSRFQETIKWSRVGDTRVRFAYVQASRGDGTDCAVVPDRCGADEYYARNMRRARQVGIRVGAYHRAFTGGEGVDGVRRDARREARVFLATVGRVRGRDLLPALDVETPFGGLGPRRLRLWINTWVRRVEDATGVKAAIYTNYSSWQATGDTTRYAADGHPLWVAQWNVDSPLVPAENWAGHGWTIWQYTSSGSVRGIKGNVDRNRLGVALRRVSVRHAR